MQNFATNLCLTLGCFAIVLLKVIISLLLSIVIFPVFIVAGVLNELVRYFVALLLYIKFRGKLTLVPAGADNIWNYKRFGNNRTCFLMAVCDKPIELETHRAQFVSKVLNYLMPDGTKPYEKLTHIFTPKFGYNCFRRDESFDIRNHIKLYPKPAGIITEESELLSVILPELSLDMNELKPQWEEVIIPQVQLKDEADLKTIRIFRYHHGYLDGASLLLMWANCMTEGGQTEFPYPVNPLKPLKISKFIIFLGNLYCIVLASFTIIKSFYIGRAAKNRFAINKYSGKRHYGWSDKIDVSLIKRIGVSTKVSVPTVLASATAGALRQLETAYPSSPGINKYVSEELLIGLVSARLPYPDIRPRNRFTVTHFHLPTGDMPWYQRVLKTNEEILKLVWEPAFHLNYFLFKFFGRFPVFVIQNIMESAGNPISFSNVPMTNRKISFLGNPTSECAGWAPLLTNTGILMIYHFCIIALKIVMLKRHFLVYDDKRKLTN